LAAPDFVESTRNGCLVTVVLVLVALAVAGLLGLIGGARLLNAG